MRNLVFIILVFCSILACSNDISPLGGNFDKVLYSETKDTLYIYHSDLIFEAYIPSTNEYVRGMWNYGSTSSTESQIYLRASGTKRDACDGIVLSAIAPFEKDINALEAAPENEFISCGAPEKKEL